MAKEYRDHSGIGGGRGYGNRMLPRLVFAILLITIAFLGYSYWVLLSGHRETTAKLTFLKAELEAAQATKTEMTKVMDSCKDELKAAQDKHKQQKDAEVRAEGEIKRLQETITNLEDGKNNLEAKLQKQIHDCKESSKQEVISCNASCDQRLAEAKKAADELCQDQQQLQQQEQRSNTFQPHDNWNRVTELLVNNAKVES